jgi:hypothetical protein
MFVKNASAPTDCIDSRNTAGWETDLEVTMHEKRRVVSD